MILLSPISVTDAIAQRFLLNHKYSQLSFIRLYLRTMFNRNAVYHLAFLPLDFLHIHDLRNGAEPY